jgi:hypothetical protein
MRSPGERPVDSARARRSPHRGSRALGSRGSRRARGRRRRRTMQAHSPAPAGRPPSPRSPAPRGPRRPSEDSRGRHAVATTRRTSRSEQGRCRLRRARATHTAAAQLRRRTTPRAASSSPTRPVPRSASADGEGLGEAARSAAGGRHAPPEAGATRSSSTGPQARAYAQQIVIRPALNP